MEDGRAVTHTNMASAAELDTKGDKREKLETSLSDSDKHMKQKANNTYTPCTANRAATTLSLIHI